MTATKPERTRGRIAIFRDHPNPETNSSMLEIRLVGASKFDGIADAYNAPEGSERFANVEHMVKAWNSHDTLVAALQQISRAVSLTGAERLTQSAIKDIADAALASVGES